MKDASVLQDQLDHLRHTIEAAQELAQKLARRRLIDPASVPEHKRKVRELLREF